ncbi:hypothetical protein [Natrinema salifodinae]|uniref:Uncharacterized protein n=1 Tax=Natrinema salifodinae TaxID=1202768 RepID=A0A1I0NMW1_9EURY|nr:hypothetical protein [Natrinema salifodinae]SEW02648.1 hypothetical protein SAMN05216285_1911 [Natrinema salifodinae]
MSLDRHAAERRRFARLLGTDGDHGTGLPIAGTGADGDSDTDEEDDRDAVADDRDVDRPTPADP